MSLATQAKRYSKSKTDYDIIQFAQLKQGLGLSLFPSQRFALRVLEKLPLDNKRRDLEIRDRFNQHVVSTFTEAEFYEYMLDEGIKNI